jgi:hypothetical protein
MYRGPGWSGCFTLQYPCCIKSCAEFFLEFEQLASKSTRSLNAHLGAKVEKSCLVGDAAAKGAPCIAAGPAQSHKAHTVLSILLKEPP